MAPLKKALPLEGDHRSCGSTCQGIAKNKQRRAFSAELLANPVEVWFT
jgi:hypothetical protein